MPALLVRAPGLFTTVQDRGRFGFGHVGVPQSGALDGDALHLANALVGNAPETALLECIGLGPTLEAADGPIRLAFVGEAPAAAVLRADGGRMPWSAGQSITVQPGDQATIGALGRTFSLCVAVEGGIEVPSVLGSRSTYVRGGFGGFAGRALRNGDALPVAAAGSGAERRFSRRADFDRDAPIRVVLGPQDDAFTADGIAAFLRGPYLVTPSADRMGFRLDGPAITHRSGPDIVSDGAVPGSIQVPGSGQPIVLLADGQSVGGYTKIATVVSVDLPRFVQRRPGDTIRFMATSQAEAERSAREHAGELAALCAGIEPYSDGLDVQALYERNLVSGVVDPL